MWAKDEKHVCPLLFANYKEKERAREEIQSFLNPYVSPTTLSGQIITHIYFYFIYKWNAGTGNYNGAGESVQNTEPNTNLFKYANINQDTNP